MACQARQFSRWLSTVGLRTLVLTCLVVLPGCRSAPVTAGSPSPVQATESPTQSLTTSEKIHNFVARLKNGETTQSLPTSDETNDVVARPKNGEPTDETKPEELPKHAAELVARLVVDQPTLRQSSFGRTLGWRMDLTGSSDLAWRWRHHLVETLQEDLRKASVRRRRALLQLSESLLVAKDEDSRAASANAIIALAREEDEDAMGRLKNIVANKEMPTSVRCAALETVALANGKTMIDSLQRYIVSACLDTSEKRPHADDALAAEALRSLAIYRSVDEDPLFATALSHPAKSVQLAALEAWETSTGRLPPPVEILDLLDNRQQQVRESALRVLSIRPIPGSYARIQRMMMDPHYQVQQAAVLAMVSVNRPQALSDLKTRIEQGGSELVRASIATAFAHHGCFDQAYEMFGDSSWRVRKAVAEATQWDPRPIAERIASELILDRSAQVQEAAVAAVSVWHIERAGPILLIALESNVFAIRKTASEVLMKKWGTHETTTEIVYFPEASRSQRNEMIERLEQSFFAQFGSPTRQESDGPVAFDLDLAIEQLQRSDSADRVAALKQVAASIQRDILTMAQAKKILVTLEQWRAPVTWSLIIKAMDAEDVGRFVILQTVLNGDHGPSLQACCQHLTDHPLIDDTEAAEFVVQQLIRLTRRSDHVTAAKALLALASTGDRRHVPWLATFLSVGNRRLRISAAVALVQLNDDRGTFALERLVREPNAQVRRALLDTLRQLKDPKFAYLIVRMLDDRIEVGRMALQTLDDWVEQGILPVGSYPPTILHNASFVEQRAAWQAISHDLAAAHANENDSNNVRQASFELSDP